MKKLYSELSEEAKASYGIAETTSDDAWLYCGACERAMRQGDCIADEDAGALRCAFDDCLPQGNLAVKSLYGWDAYRQDLGHATAHWPEEPGSGERYNVGV